MNNELTLKQRKILDFIASQIREQNLPPTIREIGKHFSIFPRAVQDHLAALEKKGVLKRTKDRARGLSPTDTSLLSGKKTMIPILGRVVAGVPLEAISNVEDFFAVDEAIAKKANFALRVKGDSMEPELHENDLVLVRVTETAESGDLVVAYLTEDGEATVKRLRRKGASVFLEAENPQYSPIVNRPFTVVGKVTSHIRTYF